MCHFSLSFHVRLGNQPTWKVWLFQKKRKGNERKEKKKRKRYPCMSTCFSSPNSKKATALTEEPIPVYSKSNMKINSGVCLSLCTSHVKYHRPTSNWPITCSFCLTHRPSVSSSWLTDWLTGQEYQAASGLKQRWKARVLSVTEWSASNVLTRIIICVHKNLGPRVPRNTVWETPCVWKTR
jgi:hypothetical protein